MLPSLLRVRQRQSSERGNRECLNLDSRFYVCLCLPFLWLSLSGFRLDPDQPTLAFERISVEQGLSNSSVNAIFQDSQGWMWFATTDGLNRFNGYEMEVYQHDPNDPTSISGNWVSGVKEDSAGNIWVTFGIGGIDIWNRDTETFTPFHHDHLDPKSLPSDSVREILPAKKAGVWVRTLVGLVHSATVVDEAGQLNAAFQQVELGRPPIRITDIALGQDGLLWVGTADSGLFRETDNGSFLSVTVPQSSSPKQIQSMYLDSENELWFTSGPHDIYRLV